MVLVLGVVHAFGLLCLLAATALLIVVSVSVPIWNSVYFLKATSGASVLTLGNWGTCLGDVCSKARLGYNVESIEINGQSAVDKGAAVVVHGLTYALVLHPIAAGFSLFALLFALGSHLVLGILGSLLSFLAFLVTLVAFGIDLGLFITAHRRLGDLGVSVKYGNALWLVLAAVVLQLLASFTVCFTRNDSRKNRDIETTGGKGGWFARRQAGNQNGFVDTTGQPVMSQRRHFWQRKNQY
ncbi:hypothetical protein RQP46_010742 [Phenoliferia psychrophenolica]